MTVFLPEVHIFSQSTGTRLRPWHNFHHHTLTPTLKGRHHETNYRPINSKVKGFASLSSAMNCMILCVRRSPNLKMLPCGTEVSKVRVLGEHMIIMNPCPPCTMHAHHVYLGGVPSTVMIAIESCMLKPPFLVCASKCHLLYEKGPFGIFHQ